MEKIKLSAAIRNIKENIKKVRKTGLIPAVLYGHNVKNQALSLSASEFDKAFKKAGESTIIDLAVDGGQNHPVLIHDVQVDVVTSKPLHVDFYQVSMTEKLKATIALEFIGESDAVKILAGTLVKNLNEVEVECLPADLPHNIIVDISALKTFHDAILVKDLKVSDKVHIQTTPEEMIAKVQPPRNVEAELEPVAVEDISKVEGAAEDKPQASENTESKKA